MKLETFFDKFEMFADAPKAVAKMRELVLELAVKGALSERHASDQVYAGWREFVTKLDEGCRDADTDLEPPFEIPTAWRWTCLDDLGTTRVRNDVEDSARVSFVPMALISSTYGVAAQSEERTWSEIKKGFTHFADGDVVMAKITPCFENAKSAVMRNLVNGVGAGTTELHVFRRGTDLVLPEFVLLYVKTRGFITRGEPRMTGSAGQKRVPREYFATSPFPLPPLAEQKRIVAKVDELMKLCDRLEAQQQEREEKHKALSRASLARFADAPTPANLQFIFHPSYTIAPADLRKSILTLAVQGKLVPQDPEDEPAEKLVEKVSALRKQFSPSKRAKAEKKIRELDDAKCGHHVPDSWTWCRLGELVLDFRYGTSRKCARNAGGVPVLRIPNIQSGRIDSTDLKFTDMPPAEFKELRLQDGDLLLVRSNGSENLVGRSAVASVDDERFAYAGYLVRARFPKNEVFAPFLQIALSTPSVRDQIEGPIRTTSGVKNINTTELSNLVLPLPPLAEQRRIVAKVDELMKLVDALETQLAASRATAANLLAAIVAELTGTPNNGKASVPTSTSTGTGRRGRPPKS